MNKRKIGFLFLVLVVVGYIREFTFVNINLRYYQVLYHPEDTYRSDLIAFLDPLSGLQLYVLKWILTILFASIFYSIGSIILSTWFGKPMWKIFGWLYIALFTIGGAAYLILWPLGNPGGGYTIARFFMGLAQSPFTVIFMIPALYLKR